MASLAFAVPQANAGGDGSTEERVIRERTTERVYRGKRVRERFRRPAVNVYIGGYAPYYGYSPYGYGYGYPYGGFYGSGFGVVLGGGHYYGGHHGGHH